MYESLALDLTPQAASAWFGLALGLAFGALGLLTGFCLRRALIGDDRRQAGGVWLLALAVAILGTQLAIGQDLISFDGHRFVTTDIPVLAIALGGVLFGIGMVLARGCIGRLWVLSGTGNLRALTVIVVAAIVTHATLKGVLAPLRTALQSQTLSLDSGTLPGAPMLWTGLLVAAGLWAAVRSGNRPIVLIGAIALGLLVPLGWVGTGFVLFDDFDPIAMESLSFASPSAESLFYVIAATAVAPGFGTGLMAGVLGGSLIAALVFGQFRLQSFETPQQTLRYLSGAVLMGTGAVLAGGCTIGAGLAGVPSLGISAVLALVSIIVGVLGTNALISRGVSESGEQTTTPMPQPAE
ncbi:YeeE/YedE family protein [Falsiphaeobacter marinintestinus]|uniref:YeeE/YedE family protein n=1 Tax=Falsiphaeobacter marinintestinus TaxID=1492905 RepID=UPI0011B73C5B|nr:YeeE/YedE family protein [Phaeobacter marinintestinus]